MSGIRLCRYRLTGVCIACLLTALPATGDESISDRSVFSGILPSVVIRYEGRSSAADGHDQVPDFQRHVVPLLGRLGCNGRACHGSFQGRGDFRLSLFGYDFQSDHDELQGRLDSESPGDSPILQKPLMQIPHEGGRRLDADAWEHRLLLSWIGSQAPPRPQNPAQLTQLQVTPAEIQFSQAGQQQLSAVACWSDGTSEDVTPLCRFQTNDDQVAEISAEGLVTAGSPGDTHVVVFYDNAVVPVPVLQPVSERTGDQYPEVPVPTEVDRLVVDKLRKLGIVPSDVCSDAEFLRRASLDVTGTLPTPAEVRVFLENTDPLKRSRKIDELLERPGYAAWWTTKLCDFTGNSDDQLNNVTPIQNQASRQWYDWILRRVQSNVPYDELVEGIVLAVSRDPDESYEQFCENLSRLYHRGSDATLADRQSLPHYWSRLNFRTSEDRVIGFTYTFLGTRIQCAQCHKHPFDRWTQEDFQAFEGFFRSTQGQVNNPRPDARRQYNEMLSQLEGTEGLRGNDLRRRLAELLNQGKVVPFGEVFAQPPGRPVGRNAAADQNRERGSGRPTARLLGGDTVDLTKYSDARKPLMAWLRSPTNPLFARAFVNRVWAAYFHRGIVHPADDLNLANPPTNAALLDYLAEGFIQQNFDMKWVHRTILNSRTYQLSWVPNETNLLDERNFSRAVPRRLPAEIAFDILAQSVKGTQRNEEFVTSLQQRSIAIPGSGIRVRNRGEADYALTVFGRSVRDSNCDCDRSDEPSLLQTIFVRNDSQLLAMMNSSDSWLAEVAARFQLPFEASEADRNNRGGQQQQARQRLNERLAALNRQLTRARSNQQTQTVERLEQQIRRVRQQLNTQRSAQDQATAQQQQAIQSAEPAEGELIHTAERQPEGWNSVELVTEAYLRTLSRFPRDAERQIAEQFIQDSGNPLDGLRSVLWALLNTREFIVNH